VPLVASRTGDATGTFGVVERGLALAALAATLRRDRDGDEGGG
jgi:hypothetical protein